MSYEIRTTQLTVLPKGEPIFCEGATVITIVDEAAGEFIEIEQNSDGESAKIRIDEYEWPAMRKAINKLIRQCRKNVTP